MIVIFYNLVIWERRSVVNYLCIMKEYTYLVILHKINFKLFNNRICNNILYVDIIGDFKTKISMLQIKL